MNRENPPPPQAVVDVVPPVLRKALATAAATDEGSEGTNGGIEPSEHAVPEPEHVPKHAVIAPQGDTAVLLIRGVTFNVVSAEEAVVQIGRADARALAEALLEFAEG